MESPKKPVTVQNSQPYGQPRPDSTGIMRNDPHPPPNFLSIGVKALGIKLNCLRLIESHVIAGYPWSDGLRSFPALSTGAYMSFSLPRTASSTVFGQVSSASPRATTSA